MYQNKENMYFVEFAMIKVILYFIKIWSMRLFFLIPTFFVLYNMHVFLSYCLPFYIIFFPCQYSVGSPASGVKRDQRLSDGGSPALVSEPTDFLENIKKTAEAIEKNVRYCPHLQCLRYYFLYEKRCKFFFLGNLIIFLMEIIPCSYMLNISQ